jgi:hypothetical protein
MDSGSSRFTGPFSKVTFQYEAEACRRMNCAWVVSGAVMTVSLAAAKGGQAGPSDPRLHPLPGGVCSRRCKSLA